MRNGRSTFLIGVLLTTAVLFVAGFWVRQQVSARQTETTVTEEYAPATPVRVAMIERRVITPYAAFHGFLVPFTELTVSTQVAGEIVDQGVEMADSVSAGQVLYRIDDSTHQIAHERALAVQQRAESELELAQANWVHVQSLAGGSSSPLEQTEAETKYRVAEAEKKRALADVHEAALLIRRSTIRSPIDGVASRIHARQGEFATQGMPLVDMIEVNRLKLVAEIEEQHVVWIKVGQSVQLSTRTHPGKSFVGSVYSVNPKALETSRKFEMEVELQNIGRHLHPGFFMTGAISGSGHSGSDAEHGSYLIIPREAVSKMFGQDVCYVVREVESGEHSNPASRMEGIRSVIKVQPIHSDPRIYQVLSGVSAGDLVVTKGIQHLADVSPVRIEE